MTSRSAAPCFGPERGARGNVSLAHELAAGGRPRGARARRVREPLDRDVRVIHEHPVVRFAGAIHELEGRVDEAELVQPQVPGNRAVLAATAPAFSGRLVGRHGEARAGRLRSSLQVADTHPLDRDLGYGEISDPGRVLELSRRRERSSGDEDVPVLGEVSEGVERDRGQAKLSLHAGMRRREKIRMALQLRLAGPGQNGARLDRRRIRAFPGVDVADVGGPRIDLRELERALRIVVDVGQRPVPDAEKVDLQRVDRLDGFLPALAVDGDLVRELAPQLRKVHVRHGPIDREVGDGSEKEQLPPVHARVEPGHEEDRGLGVRLLPDHDILQRQRKAQRLEPRLPDAGAVTAEARVHPALDRAPEGLVRHEAHERGEGDAGRPSTIPTAPSGLRRRRRPGRALGASGCGF